MRIPHLLIIYEDGRMIDVSANETLSPSRNVTMKLENRGYYAYADLQNIYVFDSKGKKDIILIKCSTFNHSTLPNTKLRSPKNKGIGFRAGDQFFIAGGHMDEILFFSTLVESWSTKRKRYLKTNPFFKSALRKFSCMTPLNRTHFLIVNTPPSNGDVTLVNTKSWKETTLPRLPIAPLPNPLNYNFTHDYNQDLGLKQNRVTCTIEFSKDCSAILTVISKKLCNVDFNYYESIMYQLDFETMEWSKRTTTIQHFGSIVVLNGVMYFINIPNNEKRFGYFYNSKSKKWLQISRPQLEFEETSKWNEHQAEKNVILVPYYGALK